MGTILKAGRALPAIVLLLAVGGGAVSAAPRKLVAWPPSGTEILAPAVACSIRKPSRFAVVRPKRGAPITVTRTSYLRSLRRSGATTQQLRRLISTQRKALERCFGIRRHEPPPSPPPPAPTPCAVTLDGAEEISVIPGNGRTLEVGITTTCSTTPHLELFALPAGGSASISGTTISYTTHPDDGTGSDTISVIACTDPSDPAGRVCSTEKRISINRCAIVAPDQTAAVVEHRASTIPLSLESSCGAPAAVELVTLPSIGHVSNLTLTGLTYTVGFAQGVDSFAIRACDPHGAGCAPPASYTVTIAAGPDFQGDPESLAPYRPHASRGEREHLVRKLANNRFDLIGGAGETLPLAELVRDRFLNDGVVSPDLADALSEIQSRGLLYGRPIPTEEFIPNWRADFDPRTICPPSAERGAPAPGPCFQPVVPANLDLNDPADLRFATDRWMMTTDRSWHTENLRYHWGYHLTTSRYLKRARYLSPVHAKMWQFWSGHFGTNTQIINGFQENLVGYYISTIEREAFGNFRSMMLGRPGGADSNGCAPLTPWEPNHGSILCDAASNMWLSNNLNEGQNQDFARELLELYLLSPFDEFTNTPNYSDVDDIVAGARFVSGIRVTERKTLAPGYGPLFAPHFDPAKHDDTPATMFTPLAGGAPQLPLSDVSFEPGALVRHLFEHNPALPRFIAAKLFATFVYPDPSDALVAELGEELRRLDFDLGAFLHRILTSEAMFSPRAAGRNCVSSPLEVYSRIINTVGLPMIPRMNSFEAELTYFYRVDNNLMSAGENILGYPTVFGYDYCGRAPGIDGSSAWLFSHLLIARVTDFIRFLNDYTGAIQGQYDLSEALSVITADPEFADGSAESVVNFFARRFDISFDQNERAILLEYLTTRRSSMGALVPVTWSSGDSQLVREKIAGLMVILAAYQQSATH